MRFSHRRGIIQILFSAVLVLGMSACDSNDPSAEPGDDDENGNGDIETYSCTVPSAATLEIGESLVRYDYNALSGGGGDITGEYRGEAAFGAVERNSESWTVIYLPDDTGQILNVSMHNEEENISVDALAEGEYEVDPLSEPAFSAYLFHDRGDVSQRGGGWGAIEITSVESGVITGTLEISDSGSALCAAFRAVQDDDLDPFSFQPS